MTSVLSILLDQISADVMSIPSVAMAPIKARHAMRGLRACEGGHAVENTCTNRYLCRLGIDLAGPQAGARENLQAVHECLSQRAAMVATGFIHACRFFCDSVDGSIGPSRPRRADLPRRRILMRSGINGTEPSAAIRAWHALLL